MDINEIISRASQTEALVIEDGLAESFGKVFKRYFPGKPAFLIADSITWTAAGKKIEASLAGEGIPAADSLIFKVPPLLHADYEHVRHILENLPKGCTPVAIGSGTINDLVKRAAYEAGEPYCCFGTAASMDGYCSAGAALCKDGRKQTMECPAPLLAAADASVLENAPPEATAAGFGDLASKFTAGADWLIADFAGSDPVDKVCWDMVQPGLRGWLGWNTDTPAGIGSVFEGLNCCGFAMQYLGRSRAASGAEHMFSHIWEMSGHTWKNGNPVSHGFQVSVGILCISAFYETFFRLGPESLDIDRIVSDFPSAEQRDLEVAGIMSELPDWEEYIPICRSKHPDSKTLAARLGRLKSGWALLEKRIAGQLPSYSEFIEMFGKAGCPVKPEDIDLSRDNAVASFKKAQCMRDRYTILDLAYEAGLLDRCIELINNDKRYLR